MSKLPRATGAPHQRADYGKLMKNLRLLNLDNEPDWPIIDSPTFAAEDKIQNQRHRIQCAEWILYKFFSILNPEETQNVTSLLPYEELNNGKLSTKYAEG